MIPIGFGTGSVYKLDIPQKSPQLFEIFASIGCTAVEINCHTHPEVDDLKDILETSLEPFSYISVHAPSSKTTYGNDDTTKHIMSEIRSFTRRVPVSRVLFHTDTFTDLSLLSRRINGFPVAVENMDHTKRSGQHPDEFKWILDTDIWLVLDVLHCYDIDPTMRTAREFIDKYHDQISEIHISGTDKSDCPTHQPLFQTHADIIAIPEIHELKVPVIIESIVQDESDLKREYEYVTELCGF